MEDESDIRCKVVIIGRQLVGKTCIINRFVNNEFGHSPQTVGAGYESRTLNIHGKNVRLQIWDTAGQEQYRSIATNYIKSSNAAIIVYSVDDTQTFDSIQEWVNIIKSVADPEILTYLVANKIDLDRTVSKADGESKANEINAKYYEVSAKSGFNIQELFSDISSDFLEQVQKNNAIQQAVTISTPNNDKKKKKGCCK